MMLALRSTRAEGFGFLHAAPAFERAGRLRHLFTTARCFDHYKTLGVTRTTSSADIKKAYLQLSKKFHPDLHAQGSSAQQAKATAKFAEITSAYSVLSDPQLKAEYDMNLMGPAAFAARAQKMRDVYDDPSYGFYKGPIRETVSPYKVLSDTGIIIGAVGFMLVSLIVHWFRFHQAKDELAMMLDQQNAIASASLEEARRRGYENGVEGQLQRLRDMHAKRRPDTPAAAASPAPTPAAST